MEWQHDYRFRVSITEDGDRTLARFIGEFDPIAILAFRRHVTIPAPPGGEVILDLTEVEELDMSGIREIRRIQADIEVSGARTCIRGASADTHRLLHRVERPAVEPSAGS